MKPELALEQKVGTIPLIGDSKTKLLSRLDIKTVKELLYHLPVNYQDTSNILTIEQLHERGEGTVKAEVEEIKMNFTRFGKVITTAKIFDQTGKAKVLWFNQKFIVNSIKKGETFLFQLKRPDKPGAKDFYCKEYERVDPNFLVATSHLGRISPIYSLTEGITTRWLRARLKWILASIDQLINEPFDLNQLNELNAYSLQEAFRKIHFPESIDEIEKARARIALEEMLELAFFLEKRFAKRKKAKAVEIEVSDKLLKEFDQQFEFEMTDDQKKALDDILTDINKSLPMNRLLNGDVGSGKTIVAAGAAFLTAKAGYSTILLAPTTILATQHYKFFTQLLNKYDDSIKIQLLTSGQALEPTTKAEIIIGTHAVLYEKYLPSNIALVIIDEQHRFGVEQRQQLIKLRSKLTPHYLNMTATPIPQTLTNVVYGDMDVSIISQLPKNRKPIKPHLFSQKKYPEALKWINDHILKSKKTEQAYIIFPLVEESEKSDLQAATKAYEELSKTVFRGLKLGLIHGRLKDKEKNEIMSKFKAKKLNILISTTVIEVGIDVPDATVMLIVGAERFGLAQLHQLRGRVGRGEKQSYCFVTPSVGLTNITKSTDRLKYFVSHSSGFDLAEYDLKTRGPGELLGTKQSGLPNFKAADITDLKLLAKAREIVRENKKWRPVLNLIK